MHRTILHCDLNNFYASVECLKNPSYRDKVLVVAGNEDLRQGVVLAKNERAKALGITTGMSLWEARGYCADLIVMPPDYPAYKMYSRKVKSIFQDYSDRIEDFGIDEAWLDVSESHALFGDGITIAKTIQKRVYEEVGLSLSIGVSYNKIFAKLGSDYKKPMGITYISEDNYRDIVWPLDVKELLYVGKATQKKLERMGIYTIGDLALSNYGRICQSLGKWGSHLWHFANGKDETPVAKQGYHFPVKSVGNGITLVKDLYQKEEVILVSYVLCESIMARMRKLHIIGKTLQLSLKNTNFVTTSHQKTIDSGIFSVHQMITIIQELLIQYYHFHVPYRYVAVKVTNMQSKDVPMQLSLFEAIQDRKEQCIDEVIEQIREKYGYYSIRRCCMLLDEELTHFNPMEDHTIHPYHFFR